MLRTIYLTFYGPEYKIYKYIFQLSDIFFVGTRKACHIFIEESNNNYKKPEGDANICPWPTHTHHPTRHLLSQHDSPLPSSRSLPNAELLQHTVYGLLRGKLPAQVPEDPAFLCFQSVQAISRTKVSKPRLSSLRNLFLVSVHHLSRLVFSCGSWSCEPTLLKQPNQTIFAYGHCDRM